MVRLTFAFVLEEPDVPVIGSVVVPITVTFSVPELDAAVAESP